MRQRDERAVAVELQLAHHVVGHAAVERHAGEVPAGGVFLARIDHHHVVVEHVRHLGEVARELAGADQHQAPARAVHRGEHAAVELEHVLPAPGLERGAAAVHLQTRRLTSCCEPIFCSSSGMPLSIRERLHHQLQRAAARQAPARGLLVGDAVGEELGLFRRRELASSPCRSGRPRRSRRTPSRRTWPSSRIATIAPTGRGAEPQVLTMVPSATRCARPCASLRRSAALRYRRYPCGNVIATRQPRAPAPSPIAMRCAVARGDLAHDGEPEAAAGARCARHAIEALEDARALGDGNARAVVLDLEERAALARARCAP